MLNMLHLTHSALDFKHSNESDEVAAKDRPRLRQRFLSLGVELHHRGPRPVAEFVSELADLAPDLAAEVQARLEAYTRIPTNVYQALGADRFTPFMIAIDGGRR